MLCNTYKKWMMTVTFVVALVFGLSLNAAANDLSTQPCTASDVEIVGNGTIVNEPCTCTGTFSARVKFIVRNNTSTGRYCIALHLVPDGVVLTTPTDLLLTTASGKSTAPGKTDTEMFGTILNFPCSVGAVCFGQTGTVKGKCDPGTCTTVAWSTSSTAEGCSSPDLTPPGGQCRHQQVCVTGYGCTLSCPTSGCAVACGGSATLSGCVQAPLSRGPFTLYLEGDDGSKLAQTTNGDASGTKCLNFTVSPTTTTKYTLTVVDRDSCRRTASTTLTVSGVTASITEPSGTPPCTGVLSYSASSSGSSGSCTFTWTIDGKTPANFVSGAGANDAAVATVSGTSGEKLDIRDLDGVCHTIAVSVDCGGCKGTASKTFKQCVSSTLSCP